MIGAAFGRETGGWALAPVLDWLFHDGRFVPDPNDLTAALGERLAAAGAPVVRLRLSMRTLHPLLTGWSAVWEKGGRLERDRVATHGLEQRASYVGSPLERVASTRQPFRRRLEAGLEAADHRLLHELAAQGATDYLAVPLLFTTGQTAAMVVVSARPGGFEDDDLAKMDLLAAALSPILETAAAHHLARIVAAAYIGPRSGARVLEGRIRRGDVEVVRAAVWFSDLRGWSRLANELPPEQAVAHANAYFELVETAVNGAGGEVLKLIGDAVLAIFPVAAGEEDGAACRAALDAAHAAAVAAAASPARPAFGIGLHVGNVVYGNVGAPTRLDFTVMGEAVNLAARLEKLSKPLGCQVVLSAELARASGRPCRDLGLQPVAGWAAPVAVFAPAGDGEAGSAAGA